MGVKEELADLEKKIAKGLELAYAKLLAFKKQKNSPLIISKNGQIVKVFAEDIESHK